MKGSITKSFGALLKGDLLDENDPKPLKPDASRHPPRVGAGVVGAASRSLTDIRHERDDLRAQLAASGPTELSSELIDPSPFPDRLRDDSEEDFATFKRTIEEEGQKVVIQVRHHPNVPGRYQVVYGHRRLRACRDLGRSVRVQLVSVSDEELAIAQGIENSARQDLSWIEKALFAWRLEKAGIKAKGIRAALSVSDAELTRFRSVCRAVPSDIIELIGRAPHVGRPRWLDLAALATAAPGLLTEARRSLPAGKDSDDRFRRLFEMLKPKQAAADRLELKAPDGKPFGRVQASGRDLRITTPKEHAEPFAAFMKRELPDLLEKFFATQGARKNP